MTADVTLSHNTLFGLRGLAITGSVKNLSAQDIKFASPADTYANDYIHSDSPSLWIELTYRPE